MTDVQRSRRIWRYHQMVRTFTCDEKSEMAARYLAGESLNSLIRNFRSNHAAVRQALLDSGVELRAHAEAWSLSIRQGGNSNTFIEQRLHDGLMAAGIGFTNNMLLLGKYLPDVVINQAPVVIEADGTVHLIEAVRLKDERRDQDLAEAGYRVFRFTGSDLNRDASACVRTVVQECGLVPEIEPVYDIRLSFSGSNHPRWTGGPGKFICSNCEKPFEKPRQHRACTNTFCSQRCYGQWMTKHPEANNAKLKRDWTDLQELYEAGMSIKQLGVHFGCSNKAISTAMRDLEIPKRPMGGRRVKGGFYKAGGLF